MRLRSRFGCLLVTVFALLVGKVSAQGQQPEPGLSTDHVPQLPLVPYSSGALSRIEGATANVDPSLSTLAPAPTTGVGLNEVEIIPRKTVVLSSQSSWENGFESLAAAFKQLDEIVMAAGFDVRGRPFAVFAQTDEVGFHFDAMLPVATNESDAKAGEVLQQAATEYVSSQEKKELPAVRFGQSPSGKAYRFVHAGPYDDIDTAYEAITTYLDNKDVLVDDVFIEEYVTDLVKPDDAALEIYIYVQPKEIPHGGLGNEERDQPQAAASAEVKMQQEVAPDKDAPAKNEAGSASSLAPLSTQADHEKTVTDETSKKDE